MLLWYNDDDDDGDDDDDDDDNQYLYSTHIKKLSWRFTLSIRNLFKLI